MAVMVSRTIPADLAGEELDAARTELRAEYAEQGGESDTPWVRIIAQDDGTNLMVVHDAADPLDLP